MKSAPISKSVSLSLKSFLASIEPLSKISKKELEKLLVEVRVVEHKKGETIFSEGDAAERVWILKTGRLEIYKYTSEGKSQVIENIYPKDLFGTLCRLGKSASAYPCTAVAAVESSSVFIPNETFFNLYKRVPDVAVGICMLCSQRLNMMQELTCATQEPVEKRIVRILFKLAKTHGNILPFTKKQIAELAGTTVETTIRTLSRFKKNNWISSSRGVVTLVNQDRLKNLIA